MLLLIYCLMYFSLFVGIMCLSLLCYTLLCVHSSSVIILTRKRKLIDFLLLAYICLVTVNILWFFLRVPWVGLQCVIVVYPDYSYSVFDPLTQSRDQVCVKGRLFTCIVLYALFSLILYAT